MKKTVATKAPKKSDQDVADLAPKKSEKVNGGFTMTVNKASPMLR